MELTPLGVPVEFEFDMNAFGSAIETKPENILSSKGRVLRLIILYKLYCITHMSYNSVSDDNFPCLEIGGMEFPVIDMYNSLMYEYDHYWSNGFGTTLPDRYKNS